MTIAEALASVLVQKGPTFEVIAIDDGSRDGSAEVARAVADDRVRFLRTEGVGITEALSRGLALARGSLIARMDADDVSLPGRFAAQVELLDARSTVVACGSFVEAFPQERVQAGLARYVAWQNSLVTPDAHRRDLFVESPLCHPSVMMRASAVASIGGYRDGPFPEDYDLFLRLAALGDFAKVERVLLRWRHGEGRLTFTDPRYSHAAIRELKARHLAPSLHGSRLVMWGAGKTGKRFARALEGHGLKVCRFLDIDPKKIGSVARGAPIEAVDGVTLAEDETLLVALGARGARATARALVEARGLPRVVYVA